jgi:hypothetical protein
MLSVNLCGLPVIQWILSVNLCRLPVIPWIPPIIITIVVVITGARHLYSIYSAWNSKNKDNNGHPSKPRHEKWFYIWIIEIAVLGGTWAFFLPIAINSGFGKDDDGAALRQALIYTTGGVLGVITLGETHRKNSLEKAKNDQDHLRQVHAERRSRYTTAIEQLSSDKASIRLGGVYTLVGLVDEWLADEKTISNIEECRKEGQTIINNLCAYIRSSFPLAKRYKELTLSYEEYQESHTKNSLLEIIYSKGNNQPLQSYKEFINDKSIFKEEQEIRKTIITEIRSHLFIRKSEGEFTRKFGDEEYTSGPWSKFIFDFSNSDFFYTADFSKSFFQQKDISFESSIFRDRTLFNHATFGGDVDFRYVYFLGFTNFSNTYFTEHPSFIKAKINVESKYNDWNFARGNGAACVGTYTPNLNGISREIPSEAVLYDISSGEQTNFFTGKQEHPKHLKESKIHKLFETFKKII